MKNEKTIDRIQEYLGKFAETVNRNIYISSIRDAMLAYMPFTVVASVFLIIAFFPFQPFIDLITNILGTGDASVWQGKLVYVTEATLSVGGLYVLIALTKSLSEYLNVNVMQSILTALASFLLLTPQTMNEGGAFISTAKISAQAIFLAMIVSIISTKIYKYVDEKGIKIKMPSSVPPAVSKPFESMIPTFIVISFFLFVRIFLELAFSSDAVTLINASLAKPLTYVGSSVFGMIIIRLVENSLWFFGLHGSSIVAAVVGPITQVLEDQNRIASLAGNLPPNIISESFRVHFAGIGWIGISFALVLFARSKQNKEIGKISLIPHLFNIGEPTMFGVPLMLNFSYLIPMLFINTISILISYFAFAIGLVPIPTGLAQVPWTTPPLISGYLVTGSIRGSILQLVLIAVSIIVWLPFMKMVDKKLYETEVAEKETSQELNEIGNIG